MDRLKDMREAIPHGWSRVNSAWRWTILAAIPGTAIGGTFTAMGVLAILKECMNCTSYGIFYLAAGTLILVGNPGITMLMEKRLERLERPEITGAAPGDANPG